MAAHPNNLPPPRRSAPPVPALGFCVQCVAELKGAAMAADALVAPDSLDLPGVSPAVMLIGGTGCCFAHLVVQTQSSLLVPNGAVPR